MNIMLQVRELLRVNDANGVRLLAIITDQFVDDPKLVIWKAQETPMTDKCRYLWDQLGMQSMFYLKFYGIIITIFIPQIFIISSNIYIHTFDIFQEHCGFPLF
jgi:hypothetical protein